MTSEVDLLAPAGCLDHLEGTAARFSAALRRGDLAATVPSCGDWSLRELAHHLGGVHRWARVAVLEGRPDGASDAAPTERDELVAWFDEGVAALTATLRAAGPEAPCWSFGPKPRTTRFWFRRQAHETAMHAHDAEAATGTPAGFPADLALDGIDEVLSMWLPRHVHRGLATLPPARTALASDEGPVFEIAGEGAPDEPAATVRGDAEALLLLLWGRIDVDDARVTVDGDRAAADAVLAGGLTP